MKLLLTGSSGLIGSFIKRNYSGIDKLLTPSKDQLNLLSKSSVDNYFFRYRPDAIIHGAGATQILLGEKERGDKSGIFWKKNVEGFKYISRNSLKYNSYRIYLSGEVVFDGRKDRPGPYSEKDLPEVNSDFLSWYGQTKKEAEGLIREKYKLAAIVKVGSVVGKGYEPRPDYIRKIIYALKKGKLHPMFDDQYISLADNFELLQALNKLIETKPSGTFHVATSDRFTPYEMAKYLLTKIGKSNKEIQASSISDFLKDNQFTFSKYSGLSTKKPKNF